MQDNDYFEQTCAKVISTRDALVNDLQSLNFEVLPSGANFIFAKHKKMDGAILAAKLREHSIIVRHFKKPARISPYIRITIGTDTQSNRLVQALNVILKSE